MSRQSQPPSRRRYAETHPTVALHLDAETYRRLVALREESGLSLGALAKQGIGLLERDLSDAHAKGRAEGRRLGREEGHRQGFEEAKSRYRLTFPCNICGQAIDLIADTESGNLAARAVAQALRGWGHAECQKQVRYEVRRREG